MNRRAETTGSAPSGSLPDVRWGASGASVRGASHVRDGSPNQDAIASWTSNDASPRAAIVSIADGHGSPRHFRSALGARFAVDVSRDVLREFASAFDAADASTRARMASVDLSLRIVEEWTIRTREHLQTHALTEAELRTVGESEGAAAAEEVEADPLLAYGATVLAALVTDRCMVLTQLGDGDILAVDSDGTTTRPLPADERLSGNLTTSICRAGAESDFRSVVVPRRATQAAVLLSTDGYANSFKSDGDFLQVGHDFVTMISKDGIASVEAQLEAILEDASTIGSGDDITLGILQCVDKRVLPARRSSFVANQHRSDSSSNSAFDARLATAEQHVRRLRLIAIFALAVALAAVGWTWRDRWPAWFHADVPQISDTPRIDGSSKRGGVKPDRKDDPVGIIAGKPDVKGEPGSGLPIGKPQVDGGLVTAVPPQIEDVQAKRVAAGISVSSMLDFNGSVVAACRFEATLWNAKDQKIESAAAVVAGASSSTTGKIRAEATIAYPKDDAKAKAMKAKDLRLSTALVCDDHAVAETKRQRIEG